MRTTLVIAGMAMGWTVGTPLSACAQEAVQGAARRVSMAEALQMFGQNSLALRIAYADLLEMQGAARQSRAYFNPSITFAREDLDAQGIDYWENTIGLEQRFEWPGRTAARGRAAGGRIEAATASYQADSVRLAFEVRQAYGMAWSAEEREATLRRTAAVIQRVADAAERRLEEGDISGYETRRLRVEWARIEQEVAVAGLEAAGARRTLATLVLPGAEAAEVGPSEPLTGGAAAGSPAHRP